jgi:hypothetical protein
MLEAISFKNILLKIPKFEISNGAIIPVETN